VQQPQIQVQQTPPLFKQAHRIIDVDVDPPVAVDPLKIRARRRKRRFDIAM
jgi:hypothetical protein